MPLLTALIPDGDVRRHRTANTDKTHNLKKNSRKQRDGGNDYEVQREVLGV